MTPTASGSSGVRAAPSARKGDGMRARRAALLDSLAALLREPTNRDLQVEGAAAVAELARAADHRALAAILRPDPASLQATWTVACYELGQLVPVTLCDLSDPVEAVRRTSACDDSGHLAAELVASSANGLRWTAVVRTGEQLRLQAPSASTISGPHDPRDLEALQDRWEQWLDDRSRWDFEQDETEENGESPRAFSPEPWGPELTAGLSDTLQSVVAALSAIAGTLRSIDERLGRIEALAGESPPRSLTPQVLPPAPPPARVDAIARRLDYYERPLRRDRARA